MKRFWDWIKVLLGFIWFPILLLVAFLSFAYKITDYKDPEAARVVLGVTLGEYFPVKL